MPKMFESAPQFDWDQEPKGRSRTPASDHLFNGCVGCLVPSSFGAALVFILVVLGFLFF